MTGFFPSYYFKFFHSPSSLCTVLSIYQSFHFRLYFRMWEHFILVGILRAFYVGEFEIKFSPCIWNCGHVEHFECFIAFNLIKNEYLFVAKNVVDIKWLTQWRCPNPFLALCSFSHSMFVINTETDILILFTCSQ